MRSPQISHQCEATGLVKYWLGRLLLQAAGWQVRGDIPPGRKFVLIGAPHTSNWDFPIGLAVTYLYRLRIHWMGKDSLFRPPAGAVMRWLGGIPVDRSSRHGVVEQMAQKFQQSEQMVLLITPSGTRSQRPHWKSGFYWIAHQAQVPVLCGYLDFSTRTACIGLSFIPSGNVCQDMERVRAFYRDVQGRHPETKTPIRLKEELPEEPIS